MIIICRNKIPCYQEQSLNLGIQAFGPRLDKTSEEGWITVLLTRARWAEWSNSVSILVYTYLCPSPSQLCPTV